MNRKDIILFAVLLIYGMTCKSQQLDLNGYISNRIKKMGTLIYSYFYKGYVIKNNDTLTCRIYLKKGKVTDDSYLFTITKNENDSLMIFSAKDIEGYFINGNMFRRFNSKTGTIFIRLVKSGRISLYEKSSTPDNVEFTYFLITAENKAYSVQPYSENIFDEYRIEGHAANNQGNIMNTKTKKLDEKFKHYFSIILGDCPKVVNLISSGYYGINDIEAIIDAYNDCKD